MKFNWPFKPEQQGTTAPQGPLPLDQEGIPILNEVVAPTELGLTDESDPNQPDLPLFAADPDSGDTAPTAQVADQEALREQLRTALLETAEQVAESVIARFRADLERTLKDEIDRVLEERFESPAGPERPGHTPD